MSRLPIYDAPQDGALNDAMLRDYAEFGFLALHDFVSVEQCERLRQRAAQLVDDFDPASVRSVFSTTENEQLDDTYFVESGDKIRFFFENNAFRRDGTLRQAKHESLNKMGHAMHDLDEVFDNFSRTAKLQKTVRGLGFDKPVILQSMYIFKPPNIGGEVVCHQDSTYLYTEPESCAGFWFALEDATVENGCMKFIPGGHKAPLKKRNCRRADGKLATETLDDSPWQNAPVDLEAPTGTLVIFDGRAPHMSPANVSAKSRHAYTLHVIDQSCHYPPENWLQRDASLPLRGFD